MGKTEVRAGMEMEEDNFMFVCVTFEISISHPRGDASRPLSIGVWSSEDRSNWSYNFESH